MRPFSSLVPLLAVVTWATPGLSHAVAGSLARDETVVAFPTVAWRIGDDWVVPVRLWVFEAEEDGVGRAAARGALARILGLGEGAEGSDVFQRRAAWFLVDDERGKRLTVTAGGVDHELPATGAAGHSSAEIRLPATAEGIPGEGTTPITELRLRLAEGDDRAPTVQVTWPLQPGVTVISDIDDTVKITGVTAASELVRRTFLQEFEAAPGMPALFADWETHGLRFVYVSSSPWQLYPELRAWMDREDLPIHGIHLKDFRAKDRTLLQLFADSAETKPAIIAPILERSPAERFVLVGDSGEKDPEVYGEMARRFPEQVARVLIRNVTGEHRDSDRFRAAMDGVPAVSWELFTEPAEITWRP